MKLTTIQVDQLSFIFLSIIMNFRVARGYCSDKPVLLFWPFLLLNSSTRSSRQMLRRKYPNYVLNISEKLSNNYPVDITQIMKRPKSSVVQDNRLLLKFQGANFLQYRSQRYDRMPAFGLWVLEAGIQQGPDNRQQRLSSVPSFRKIVPGHLDHVIERTMKRAVLIFFSLEFIKVVSGEFFLWGFIPFFPTFLVLQT